MRLLSSLAIRWRARKVGADEFGNRYYQARSAAAGKKPRRFVVYKGQPEASKVPADWHGWLHYTEDSPPPEQGYARHSWEKPHLPNLTGTDHAYRPKGHPLKGGKRAAATGDYEPWKPV